MTLETLNRTVDDVSKAIEKQGSIDIPQEEQQEVKKLVNLFYKYKKYRSQYDQKWLEYYKMFRGCQWGDRPKWKNTEIVNMVWSTIQANVPLQTDVRPKFQFLPQNPEDVEIAKILEEISNSDWEKYNWLRQVTEVIYDGCIYGTGFSSLRYDQALEYGIGGCEYQSEEPYYCYPDPDAKEINDGSSQGFFKAYPITTSKLKNMFPDRSDAIKPDISDFLTKSKTDLKSFMTTYFNSDLELPEGHWGGSQDSSKNLEKTLVIEGFLKPQDIYECEENITQDEKKYTLKKKFPEGRHVLIANGMLLVDEPLDIPNVIPFARYNNYILPREFYGVSDIEQLESPQRIFNKILSFTLDCLALTSNPVWIVDTNSDVDTDNLSNIPGGIVEKNPGTEVRRENGAMLNPALLQILDKLVVWFNDTAGNSEFSRGQAPGGVTAASAIEQLIAASRTRIRQKQRNLDEYLKNVGEQYKSLVLTKYSFPKIYRLLGENSIVTWRKFYIDAGNDGNPVAVTEKWEQQPNGEVKKVEDRSIVIAGDFDIVVRTGSDLPFEVANRENKAYQLFDRGIIDAQQLLEDIQYPAREKVLSRMAEQQAMGAGQPQQQGARANA